jgi:dynein heavy chain
MADKEASTEPVIVPVDARVNWFEDKVCGALKVKQDKWKKMVSTGELV